MKRSLDITNKIPDVRKPAPKLETMYYGEAKLIKGGGAKIY